MKKVLIVESDPLSRLYMEASLATLGMDSEIAETGEEAVAILRKQEIRMVVCDWMMPDMAGLDLCRQVRAHKGSYVYFILYMPTDATKKNEDAAIDSGFYDQAHLTREFVRTYGFTPKAYKSAWAA